MKPRELPDLTVGNCPTMSYEADSPRQQSSTRWLIACSVGLLIAAGITASLVTQPSNNTPKNRAAIVRPVDHDPTATPKRDPRIEPAERTTTPGFEIY